MTKPKQFGPTYPGSYPPDMRTQLWPLCCGARIISGFKAVASMSVDDIVKQIEETMEVIPDHQVFQHEQMKPKHTFLTLNAGQMATPKIMEAITKAGFKLIGTGRPRGSDQGFFLRDDSNTWKAA